jgi:hypothetical protein
LAIVPTTVAEVSDISENGHIENFPEPVKITMAE